MTFAIIAISLSGLSIILSVHSIREANRAARRVAQIRRRLEARRK